MSKNQANIKKSIQEQMEQLLKCYDKDKIKVIETKITALTMIFSAGVFSDEISESAS